MSVTLIADSGATKAEWCLLNKGEKETLFTQGISPYFLNTDQIANLVKNELSTELKKTSQLTIFIIMERAAQILKTPKASKRPY